MNLRRRTWEVVEAAKPGDTVSRIFDVLLLSLIILNVVAVIVGSIQSVHERWEAFFRGFEIASVLVFTAEYLIRLWSCTAAPPLSPPNYWPHSIFSKGHATH